ncbi:MAG: neutral/alkaline non-lysosomal ceramidase N-terminal domain-containing protein [Candidatus Heimdallarchaeota archaeon]
MSFKVGIGMYDCTGPAAEQPMMGYGDSKQRTLGIADRQWVRSFVIQDNNDNYVCLAVADICMVFQSVKNEVVKRLSKKFGGMLKADNIMLSATHTHSAAGGYSLYPLFTISSKGFCKQTFEVIVNGYVQAIIRAWNNMKPAKIFINTCELLGCGGQRSREAWESNPQVEKEKYGDTDKSFALLRFIDLSGKLFGTIAYYALHGTSIGEKNRLLSSDNRGYASRLLERLYGNNPYEYNPNFIAAFPNANGGDVSPNVNLGHPPGGEEDYRRMKVCGNKLYQKTLEMINSEAEEITGDIKFGKTNVDLALVQINRTSRTTCDGAFGVSFTGASSEDSHSSIPLYVEGLTKSELLDGEAPWKYSFRNKALTFLLDFIWHDMDDSEWVEAQGEKPILLPVGRSKFRGMPFFPKIYPFQIFKLGSICIVGYPGEITTIAGIRLKNTILDTFKETEAKYCVLNCYANSYSSYTTTKEEYSQQNYEGACTLYGPNQLEAVQQEYGKIAEMIRENKKVPLGVSFPKYPSRQKKFRTRIRFDNEPFGKDFGDVITQPNSSYKSGEKVITEFVGANPRNNLRTMDSFLEVQRKENGNWETIYKDFDFETEYHWKRKGITHSIITVIWKIPERTKTGKYRIVHNGDSKSRWTKRINPYKGITRSFDVIQVLK